MEADHHNALSADIVDAAVRVHQALGPGLLETVYRKVLAYELGQRAHQVESERVLPVRYHGLEVETGYRLDLLVDECVVVEIKSVESVLPVHKKQLLTYLRLSGCKLGLLLNFNVSLMKQGIHRVVDGL